jgi:hypothetical protein
MRRYLFINTKMTTETSPDSPLETLRKESEAFLKENAVKGIGHGQIVSRATTPGGLHIERIAGVLRLDYDCVKNIGSMACDVTTKVRFYDDSDRPPDVFHHYLNGAAPARETLPADQYPIIASELTKLITGQE